MVLVAFGCASLAAPSVHADETRLPFELEWQAPAECPTRDLVLEKVRRLVDVREGPHEARIEAHASIRRRAASFELAITVREGGVEDARVLRSPTCGVLADAAAIMLATALDESRRSAAGVEATRPTDTPRPAEVVVPPRRERAPSAPGRAAPAARTTPGGLHDAFLGAGAVFDFGTLPRPASGLEVSASVEIGVLRTGITAAIHRGQRQTFASFGQAGADFGLQTAGVFGCWIAGHGRFRFGPCGATDLTHMRAEGFGIRRPGVSRALFPTLRVGLLSETRVGSRFSVFARADASFALGAPSVVITTTASRFAVHDVDLPALRLTVGASLDVL